MLKEKDEQCRHIASVLHTKNAEWKRIKLKLSENKLQEHNRRDSTAIDDIEVIIEQNDQQLLQDNKDKDNSDDCTQLPPQSQSPQIPQTAETQSHLDALIDLLSENDDGDETTNDINPLSISRNSSFAIESSKIQKRKSHARGCSCCDKVRRRGLEFHLHFISFIRLQGHHQMIFPLRLIPSWYHRTLRPVSGTLHSPHGNKN